MKKGDKVKIYCDPITQKKLEGEAILIKKRCSYSNEPWELWKVKFINDPNDNGIYDRIILKEGN